MSLFIAMYKTYKANHLDRKEITKLQQKRLRKLVKYAKQNSKFFAKLYNNIDLNSFNLHDLPILNKRTMMENFDEYVTDRNITMKKINEYTKNIDNVGRMLNNKYLIFKTSGSTGYPATILYDKQNIDVASAVAAFRTFARKEDFSKFMKNGKKTAGVFANYGFYLACGMSRYLSLKMPGKNNKITIDVNLPEQEIVSKLNDFKPSMLSGYPSNLALLANFKELNISPDVVITGGELLTEDIREKLENKFNCYVQTHYSCTEAGEIACECKNKHLHINEDWVIVEPVDKDNNPVDLGVESDKVLITNLSNYIQPFIRYELTDRVIVHNTPCGCGNTRCWIEIEGRTDDILEFENNIQIAPMSLYKLLQEVEGMLIFQLVQKDVNTLELRLIAKNKEIAFEKAKSVLLHFLDEKGISNVQIIKSKLEPQANKVSGKFKHIYKDF